MPAFKAAQRTFLKIPLFFRHAAPVSSSEASRPFSELRTIRTSFAQVLIWIVFLLVVDPIVAAAALRFGSPISPAIFYGCTAGLLATALALNLHRRPSFEGARLYFTAFAILVVIGAAMYRGERIGPEYGAPLLLAFVPSNISYVVWPALNLITSATLFLFARDYRFRNTILTAAFGALIVQLLSMEADMWWPALFGDSNGRAGGLAQNANAAALLVVTLTALTLPAKPGRGPGRFSIYAVPAMVPAVLLSQSRAGMLAAALCLTCFVVALFKRKPRWSAPAFVLVLLVAFGATVMFSPVLNPSKVELEHREQVRLAMEEASQKAGELPTATLDLPVTPAERFISRISMDESASLRLGALKFFLGVAKDHPFGIATGYTNKFQTGPHNAFVKLAVDEGIIAAFCLLVMMSAATWRALRTRSPALLAICMTAWIASMVYHTFMIDAVITIALAVGLGIAAEDGADKRAEAEESS